MSICSKPINSSVIISYLNYPLTPLPHITQNMQVYFKFNCILKNCRVTSLLGNHLRFTDVLSDFL